MKFFYNGIKGSDGKLQKCSYAVGPWMTKAESMIRIYGKHYEEFTGEISQAFKIENGSDFQSDYFEEDHIDVYETHPLYREVKAAYLKQQAHRNAKWAKRGVCNCFCGSVHIYGSCQKQAVA